MKPSVGAMALVCMLTATAGAETFHVYYLGGQSNMDGFGYARDLDDELSRTSSKTLIFHGNTAPDGVETDGRGIWSALRPGHGVGFKSDGKINEYSERFGVEVTFARRLQKRMPDRKIAIIKYSCGGTSIHLDAARHFGCWDPDYRGGQGSGKGVNQFDHCLATFRHAMADRDIDDDGEEDQLIPAGIVWMQGESDGSADREVAESYEANLKRLIDLIRAALRTDDLPVVIGRISDSGQAESGNVWPHGTIVRQAQADFVEKDERATLVTSTDEYNYSDPWHYDSAGYIDLGQQFADAMADLVIASPR